MRMRKENGYPFCDLFFNKSDILLFIAWICYTYAIKT